MKEKIILFGGSFDPIHFGHLILAQSAVEFLKAKKVIFIPCYIPPHKISYKLTNWRHRLKMLKLALNNNRYFELSDFEIKRKKTSYTYITVDWFSRKYSNYQLYFLIGYDLLLDVTTWQNWELIVDKLYFLVGKRLVKKNFLDLPKKIYKKTIFFDSPIVEISSTIIREKIKNNLSIKYLVPEKVENYIIKNRIYF